jgi:DNA-binding transcriptional ArsR family regulator
MDSALRAIAEPHRREIVRLVRSEELSAGQIASHFDVSRPAVSQHLRFLKEAGLLTERRQGTRRFYRAEPKNLAALKAFIEVFLGEETSVERAPSPSSARPERGRTGVPRKVPGPR